MRLALTFVLFLAAGCAPPRAALPIAPDPSFEQTVDRHLAAIAGRDLDGLLATVTDTDDLRVIFPDGSSLTSREAYRTMHTEWFADSTWTMTFERMAAVQGSDTGTALVRWTMVDGTPRSGRQAWLALTFRREGADWRLVLDQNTAITVR
jgi:ketosteroid isomerase-like protein